jgi:hypothetical protein
MNLFKRCMSSSCHHRYYHQIKNLLAQIQKGFACLKSFPLQLHRRGLLCSSPEIQRLHQRLETAASAQSKETAAKLALMYENGKKLQRLAAKNWEGDATNMMDDLEAA